MKHQDKRPQFSRETTATEAEGGRHQTSWDKDEDEMKMNNFALFRPLKMIHGQNVPRNMILA